MRHRWLTRRTTKHYRRHWTRRLALIWSFRSIGALGLSETAQLPWWLGDHRLEQRGRTCCGMSRSIRLFGGGGPNSRQKHQHPKEAKRCLLPSKDAHVSRRNSRQTLPGCGHRSSSVDTAESTACITKPPRSQPGIVRGGRQGQVLMSFSSTTLILYVCYPGSLLQRENSHDHTLE